MLVLSFVLPLLGAGLAEADGAKVPKKAADEETVEERMFRIRVDAAITRGAQWLAKQQHEDGAFRRPKSLNTRLDSGRHDFGETALATLTLAHCGFGPKTDVMKKAVAYLKSEYRSQMRGDFFSRASTYSLSIYVLALHELYGVLPATEQAARHDGRYAKARLRKRNPCSYPKFVQSVLREVTTWLAKHQAHTGLFRYPGGTAAGGPEDLSNTQYALLAFWVASLCGRPVKSDVLERVARRLLAIQEPDGPATARKLDPTKSQSRYGSMRVGVKDRARGFSYIVGERATGAMTSAGLSSLLIVKSMLNDMGKLDLTLRKKLDQAIWDSIAWLDVHYDVSVNPFGRGSWHYYYLYGLERAFVIANKRFIGEHDWYLDGASLLMLAQRKNGRWAPPNTGWGPVAPGAIPHYGARASRSSS